MRARNRQHIASQPVDQSYPPPLYPSQGNQQGFPTQIEQPRGNQQFYNPPRGSKSDSGFIYDDSAPVMSGTPYDNYPPPNQSESSDSYGDKGFSRS